MTSIAGRADVKGDFNYYRHTILNSLRLLNSRFRPDYGKMLIAIDSPVPSWRKEVFPYYKSRRKTNQQASAIDWAEQKAYAKQMTEEIKNLHWQVVAVDRAEADDIIAVVAKQIAPLEKTVIVSRDKDFIQLQSDHEIDQWDGREARMLRSDNPSKQLFELVVKGDSADDIPNVFSADDHYVNKGERAKKITQKMIDEWWDNGVVDIIKLPGFRRNIKLIDFNSIPKDIVDSVNEKLRTYQPKPKIVLDEYLMEHQLSGLYKFLGDF